MSKNIVTDVCVECGEFLNSNTRIFYNEKPYCLAHGNVKRDVEKTKSIMADGIKELRKLISAFK